jgi:hypothetical protein
MRLVVSATFFSLLVSTFAIAGDAKPADTAAAAPSPEQLKTLIDKLGHDSFDEREKATEELVKLGSAALEAVGAREKESADLEVRARCVQIREAIGDPNATALAVLDKISKSDGMFVRPGSSRISLTKHYFTGPEFARHLRKKAALHNFSLSGPAGDFVEKVASESSLKQAPYTIRLNDGSEKELKAWLSETLKLKLSAKKEEPAK